MADGEEMNHLMLISILCLCIPTGVSAQPLLYGEWGSTGSGNGEFSQPIGIEVNQTNEQIYVVDNFNDRIQVFNWQGDFLFSFGEGVLNSPKDITIGASNYVYVVTSEQIVKFTGQGAFVTAWGDTTADVNDCWACVQNPHGIAWGAGRLYVADTEHKAVKVYDPDGNYLFKLDSVPGQPNDSTGGHLDVPLKVAVYQDRVFVIDPTQFLVVQEYESEGPFVANWGVRLPFVEPYGPGIFNGPKDIAIDGNGFIYIPDNGRTQVFDSFGTYVTEFEGTGIGIAVGPNNNRIFITSGDTVERWQWSVSGVPAIPITWGQLKNKYQEGDK